MEPRGLRNNNPGNIRTTKDRWQGLRPQQTDPAFFQFTEMRYGYRALIITAELPAQTRMPDHRRLHPPLGSTRGEQHQCLHPPCVPGNGRDGRLCAGRGRQGHDVRLCRCHQPGGERRSRRHERGGSRLEPDLIQIKLYYGTAGHSYVGTSLRLPGIAGHVDPVTQDLQCAQPERAGSNLQAAVREPGRHAA